ncbi:hypothetical protein [Solidesulfovibrio magneticus]|nr:hypothetical protein [Solidesulfovibrio magneticus]
MGRQISKESCAEAVIKGIKKAQRNYEQWSGGDWVWTAAEYMLTVYVAKEIYAIDGTKYVTIEHNVLQAINDAGAIAPGPKPKNARVRGRFDILLWWASEYPRAVVEIKNQPYGSDVCTKDFNRIDEVLRIRKEESSLEFGMFGFYTSAIGNCEKSATDKVVNKIRNIKQLAIDTIGRNCKIKLFHSKIYTDKHESAWAAGCLLIERR